MRGKAWSVPLDGFAGLRRHRGLFLLKTLFSFAEKTSVSSSAFCRFSRGLGFRSLHSSISAKLFRRLLKIRPCPSGLCLSGLCLSGSGKSVDLIYSIINGYCSIFSVFGSRKVFLGRVVLSPLGRFCRPQKTQGSFLAQNPFSFAEKTPVSSSVFCRFSRGLGFRSLHSSISAKLFRRLLKIRPCPSGLCLSPCPSGLCLSGSGMFVIDFTMCFECIFPQF